MGRYFASTILIIVLIFVLAACGNSDKDVATEPPESTSKSTPTGTL